MDPRIHVVSLYALREPQLADDRSVAALMLQMQAFFTILRCYEMPFLDVNL